MGFVIVGLLGGNYTDINEGLFGYNLVLTAIALGVTFKTTMNSYLVTGCGVLLTVFIHLGLNTLLEPWFACINHAVYFSNVVDAVCRRNIELKLFC